MKKLFVLLVCLCTCVATSFAQQGEQRVGIRLNYGNDTNLGLGVNYRYNFTDNWRIEPAFDYYFKNDHVSMWDLGANMHYLFPLAQEVAIYPLAGVYYTNYKVDWGKDDVNDGNVAINLGCGLDYNLASNITLNAEAKYMIIDNYNQLVIGVGVAFAF